MKNSFLIYYEYEEQLSILSDEELGQLIRAIFKYEKNNEIPKFTGVLQIAFLFIKGNLDRDREKYDKRCETSANNGKLGGRPPKEKPNLKPNKNLKKPKKADNDIDNDNDNEIDIDNDKDNKKEKIKRKVFQKPTVEEINQYCTERGNKVDPQRFFDFYESKGWKVGKEPMKDWKACVRTWEKNKSNTSQSVQRNTGNVFFNILREEGKMK